jgi:hypothetical protein
MTPERELLIQAVQDYDACGAILDATRRRIDVLLALPATPRSEPVAWRYRYHHGAASENKGMWKYADTEDECNRSAYYEREPLFAAPQSETADTKRLRALLQALECNDVEKLLTQEPAVLSAVGGEIARAAKLGAHLYQSRPTGNEEPK